MLHGSPKKLDFLSIFQIDFPSLSQLRSINCPDKQTESQLIFQIGKIPAQRRLTDIKHLCRLRNASALRHRNHIINVPFHHLLLNQGHIHYI